MTGRPGVPIRGGSNGCPLTLLQIWGFQVDDTCVTDALALTGHPGPTSQFGSGGLPSASSPRSSSRLWLLLRPLAADEHRALFWVRHVQIGVVLTEVSAAIGGVYVIIEDRPQRRAIVALAGLVMLIAPLLLALPMRRWCRDIRGALVFYAWSVATTLVITRVALLDGGATSPLTWLFVLTLTYVGLAYPPMGVAVTGALMVACYLWVALTTEHPVTNTWVPATVLALFTLMIAWVSENQWDMAERQGLMTQRLATLAGTDELTSCLNRRAFDQRLSAVLSRASVHRPVSLCMLDLDGFKRVNDSRGHAAGDQVLVAVARALLTTTRETDTVCRLGGDEFAVLLPDTSAASAAATSHRLLAAITSAVACDGIGASIGVAATSKPMTLDAFLAPADTLMYQAKAFGGNQAACQGSG